MNRNEITNSINAYIAYHDMSKPVNLMTLATICTTEIPRDERHSAEVRQAFFRAVSEAAKTHLNAAYAETAEDFNNLGLWIMTYAEKLAEPKQTEEAAL